MNWTSFESQLNATHPATGMLVEAASAAATAAVQEPLVGDLASGAVAYIVVVIVVYGMSIVLLISAQIYQRPSKMMEDRQINKYLKEFQVEYSKADYPLRFKTLSGRCSGQSAK